MLPSVIIVCRSATVWRVCYVCVGSCLCVYSLAAAFCLCGSHRVDAPLGSRANELLQPLLRLGLGRGSNLGPILLPRRGRKIAVRGHNLTHDHTGWWPRANVRQVEISRGWRGWGGTGRGGKGNSSVTRRKGCGQQRFRQYVLCMCGPIPLTPAC